jgi:hypothetical protein
MTRTELYETWAPPGAIWSPWAKPVLFATLGTYRPDVSSKPEFVAMDLSWAPRPAEGVALIVDLPDAASVHMGLALAERGFRPVPLYNTTPGFRAALPLNALIAAVELGAEALTRLHLPPDAPPVFLLDQRRSKSRRSVGVGEYDNRWLVFPQDFPSANFLLARRIQRVVVVSPNGRPADDLTHVLLRWQKAGLPIYAVDSTKPETPARIKVARPPRFRRAWYRALVITRLRRNSAGGFGAVVPEQSSGGGHGFA